MKGFIKLAVAHEDPEKNLSEEETGLLKSWILWKIDCQKPRGISPRFIECRMGGGGLRITCTDQDTKDWLGQMLQKKALWEGAKLRYVKAKNLSKPVRALVRIPGPPD